MTVTAGALSQTGAETNATSTTLTSAAATGGTGPYTYQWYMSTVNNFTPGAGNLVANATALVQAFSGLLPGTTYYFVVIATDSTSAAGTSSQLTLITPPYQIQNQFAQNAIVGMVDQRINYNTQECMIDVSETATNDQAGTAVKAVTSSTGIQKVIACTADSDNCVGFINYDVKAQTYGIGDVCEVSKSGNVMYLVSVGAISAGVQVQLDLTYVGGVKTKTGSSGASYVGVALDSTTASGQLLRVELKTPSFTTF